MSLTSSAHIRGTDPGSGRPMTVDVADGLIRDLHFLQPTGNHSDSGWLAPGLVDLQVNGFGGHDLNSPTISPQTVLDLAHAMLRTGVTTFLPTLITAAQEQLLDALAVIQEARRMHPLVARMIPYVHVEGPAIAPEDGPRGAHPAAHVRPPCVKEFERWQAASGGMVGMVTLSPHWPQAPEYISYLKASGVHVALGHTDASSAQIAAAVRAGARLSTHLGNGSHARLNRRSNPLWAQLADDRLCASFIADGHHLSADVLKVMLRSKGLERSLIVSDATAIAGMPAGLYDASIGGAVSLSADGRLSPNDGSGEYLAGAALPLLAGVATLVRQVGLRLDEALKLATCNPGRWVGGRGLLAKKQVADLVRFDWDGESAVPKVTGVWLDGQQIV